MIKNRLLECNNPGTKVPKEYYPKITILPSRNAQEAVDGFQYARPFMFCMMLMRGVMCEEGGYSGV